jgi:hypothetical protein
MAFFVSFSRGGSATAADTAVSTPEPSPFGFDSFIKILIRKPGSQELDWHLDFLFMDYGFQIFPLIPAFLIHYLPHGAKNAKSSERRAFGQMPLASTRLGGIDPGRGLLAAELAAAGRPDGLSVLSAVARIHFGGRCVGGSAHGRLGLEAVSQRFRAAFFYFGAGLVAV